MRIRTLLYILVATILGSCLDPYYPEINDYLDLPVVEGSITNGPGPYIVKLSRSVALDNMKSKPIRGAIVTISDDTGIQETLWESAPGTYSTSVTGIKGVTGRSYRLTIETDGKTYQSNYETLKEPVDIDSVYTRLEKKVIEEGTVQGLQFYVSTKDMPDKNTQLLWTYQETYKFRSDLRLDYIFYSRDSMVNNESDSGSMCWQTVQGYETFSFSDINHTGTRLANFPLHYIDGLTNKLSVRYSVLVYQYTISESAYHYWNEIEKLHEESGSLYTRQPYQVTGNLKNLDNTDDIMLGYFMVAGVSTKRVYVDPPPIDFNYSACIGALNVFDNPGSEELRFPMYAMLTETGDMAFGQLFCFDCRKKGGTETKPEFWEEDAEK